MRGSKSNVLKDPYGFTNDPITNQLYVVDTDNYQMMSNNRGSRNDSVIAVGNSAGSDTTQFNRTMSVRFDTISNSLLIANFLNNDVLRLVAEAKNWA